MFIVRAEKNLAITSAKLIKWKLVLKSSCPFSFNLIGSPIAWLIGGKGAILQLSNDCHVKPYKVIEAVVINNKATLKIVYAMQPFEE